MGKIADGILKDWQNGQVVGSSDYKQEREILRVAINDNHDRLLERYTKAEIDTFLDTIKGVGWTTETIKDNYDLIQNILLTRYTKTEVDSFIQTLQSQINANDSDISTLQSRVTNVEGRSSNLESRVSTTEARITETETDIVGLQNQINSNDTDISSLDSRVSVNEYDISNLKTKDNDLQTQINTLNDVYSTDAERIAAINDVINQFEIADDDLEALINNKANKSDTYTRSQLWTKSELESLIKFNQATDKETGLVTGREVFTIVHNMNDYPNVHVVAEKGYGHYGYGAGSFGISSDKFRLPVRVDYPNENSLVISTDEHYEGSPSVSLNGNVARVTFSDEQVGLDVYLRGIADGHY